MATLARVVGSIKSLPALLGRADSRSYIPELDGLRCLAIMVVLVWHASLRAARYIVHANDAGASIGDFYAYFPHGEIGVALFFFISGFVVSQPFIARPRSQWRVGDFYKRRFVRIYPPYLVAITLCFLVLGVVGHAPADAYAFRDGTFSLNKSFLASLVYMHGIVFDMPSRLNPPMWSLEIEVLFYAILPLLMMAYVATASRRLRLGVVCAAILAASTVSSLLIQSPATDLRFRWGLFYHAYLFLAGIVAADIFAQVDAPPHRRTLGGDVVFGAGVTILVAVGLAMTKHDARMLGPLYAAEIQALTILSLALVFVGAFRGRMASRLLALPWVRLVGTMCYSLYLTHIIVMTAVGEVLARLAHTQNAVLIYAIYLGVLIPAALVVGGVFYVCVERPFARRLAGGRPARDPVSVDTGPLTAPAAGPRQAA